MSFGLNNDNNLKAHSAYKDGGGLGGGGMYFKNKGKEKNNSKKDEQEEDMFEYKDSKKEGEISLSKELSDSEIPNDSLYNKFVNWYRNIGK